MRSSPMTRCSACASDVAASARFCPDCGAALDVSETPTGTAPRPRAHSPVPARSGTPAPEDVRRGTPVSPSTRARSTTGTPTPSRASATAQAQGRFPPGELLLGRYRIVERVGKGGMGDVYRADDLTLDQPVALKFLPPALGQDPDRLERFFGEVRTARTVSHPAVCRVYDIGERDGEHFLSMEYVDGEALAALLRRIGRFSGTKALDVARQICAGLFAAHERRVLHRDLKPENVMLDAQGKVRIADFGLAGIVESFDGDDVRSGTPAYMSPEQHAGREVSVKSDIYSLGLVLYELFTGRRAFAGKTLADLRQQHLHETPEPPSAIVPDLDPATESAILRCLEKDPRRRPASALMVSALLP